MRTCMYVPLQNIVGIQHTPHKHIPFLPANKCTFHTFWIFFFTYILHSVIYMTWMATIYGTCTSPGHRLICLYVPLPFTVAFLIQACVAGMDFGFMTAFNTWTRQTCITDERMFTMSLSAIASNLVTLKNIYVQEKSMSTWKNFRGNLARIECVCTV